MSLIRDVIEPLINFDFNFNLCRYIRARQDLLDGRGFKVRGDEAWAAALTEDSERQVEHVMFEVASAASKNAAVTAGGYTRPLLSST